MKRICIVIFLILTCFNQLFAPNLTSIQTEQKNVEFDLISKLNEVLTEDLKEYCEFVEYREYNKPTLVKATHKILLIKAIELTEIGRGMVEYNKLSVDQKVKLTLNRKEQAVGLLQMRPIMYRHIIKELKLYTVYNIHSRWKADKAIRMFIGFQDHYNPNWNIERVSRDWNGGGGLGMKKRATIKYYKKVNNHYNNLKLKYFPDGDVSLI